MGTSRRGPSALLLLAVAAQDGGAEHRGGDPALTSEFASRVDHSASIKARGNLTPELETWLRDASVSSSGFARATLYSWTTDATAARLRDDREIFDDNQLPEGPTAYVQLLERVAHDSAGPDGALARILIGHPDLRRRRYAWVRPWATRLGLGPRDYGTVLIRVDLAPSAIVGRFDPSGPVTWRFSDLDGRPVSLARALADPGRIGAILHVRRDDEGALSYREYVLCNESMIGSWSLATPAITAALAMDARHLRALAQHNGDLESLLRPAMAFDAPHYAPSPGNLELIARALVDSKQAGDPVTVRPQRRFDITAAPALVTVRRLPPRRVVVDA